MISYSLEQKGYCYYNPITCKIWVSRDVVSDELSHCYGTQKFIQVDVEKEEVQEKGAQQQES